MSDFLYLFRTNPQDRETAMGTPERAQKSMDAWMAWVQDLEAKGHLKTRGSPLQTGGKVVRASKSVTDGPFAEAKDIVLGYMIVQARDAAQAAELAKGCPILGGPGGSVEVRPLDERMMR